MALRASPSVGPKGDIPLSALAGVCQQGRNRPVVARSALAELSLGHQPAQTEERTSAAAHVLPSAQFWATSAIRNRF